MYCRQQQQLILRSAVRFAKALGFGVVRLQGRKWRDVVAVLATDNMKAVSSLYKKTSPF
jgi:hypothetical protein